MDSLQYGLGCSMQDESQYQGRTQGGEEQEWLDSTKSPGVQRGCWWNMVRQCTRRAQGDLENGALLHTLPLPEA